MIKRSLHIYCSFYPSQSALFNVLQRQLSPEPSTSGLQNQQLAEINSPVKKLSSEDEYEFDYESDCYGDSDSDGYINKGPVELDHWRCSICNKIFKSLKEKLLHAGQHSPCPGITLDKKSNVEMAALKYIKGENIKSEDMTVDVKFKGEMELLNGPESNKILPNCFENDTFRCLECSKDFPSIDELFIHRRNVFKSPTTCQICHLKFPRRLDRVQHMKTHSMSNLECIICDRKYQSHYSWSQHQLGHMGLAKYECKVCSRGFQKENELIIHNRKHTGEKPFKCQTCSKTFFSSQILKRHLFTHMEGQEVDCDICHKTFKNILCLQKHRLHTHSKGKKRKAKAKRDFLCPTCDEVFPTIRKLMWHQETHEKWPKKCQRCGDCFIHQSSLTKHIRQAHDPQHQTVDGKAENNATCRVCQKVFKKSSLAQHMRIHSGDKPFKCNICNKQFSVKCNMTAHKWVHMGVRDRPFKCKLCERSFSRPKSLESHVRSHKNIRPFTCNECGKSFIHRNNLRLHVKEHSGKKEHVCSFCGKTFFRKYNLTNHIRVHTGETPYECTVCHKDFTQKSNYNVHMKAFHGSRPIIHEEV